MKIEFRSIFCFPYSSGYFLGGATRAHCSGAKPRLRVRKELETDLCDADDDQTSTSDR
jgi:hypothetical protein